MYTNIKNKKTRKKNLILLIISILIIISLSQQAFPGCCTYHTYTRDTCIPADLASECPDFYNEQECSDLQICQYIPGCCIFSDTCIDAYHEDECQGFFNPGLCPTHDECLQGCCVCTDQGDNVCYKDVTLSDCNTRCANIEYDVLLYNASMHGDDCDNNCELFVGAKSNITGTITDTQTGDLISATITAGNQIYTTTNGTYKLTDIPSGQVLVRTTATEYITNSTYLDIPTDPTTITFNPKLEPATTGKIFGTITSEQTDNPIQGALVTLTRGTYATTLTDESGYYEFNYLPLEDYTITVTKQGFETDSEITTLREAQKTVQIDLSLTKKPAGILQGKTQDQFGIVPVSAIYVDDILNTFSDSNGDFSIELLTGQTYNVYSIGPYHYKSDIYEFTPMQDQTTTHDFTMEAISSSCAGDHNPTVISFYANHIPGEEAVQLTWTPENCNNIEGYFLYRDDLGTEPFKFITTNSYKDSNVEWTITYTYNVVVVYNDKSNKNSLQVPVTITLGDPACENRYIHSYARFTEFCDGDFFRKTCDNKNKIKPASTTTTETTIDCRTKGTGYFCSGPDSRGFTYCKDRSACDPRKQNALPFGLYYNEDDCTGEQDINGIYENYCYYDYSTTVPDKCFQCNQDLTCFDYQSQGACETDSCLAVAPNTTCEWYSETQFIDLGKGICYQTDYNKTDQCSKCSADSLFFNIGCTQDICEKLGNCFLDGQDCSACEAVTCEELTQDQCGGSIEISPNSTCPKTIMPSSSICGLEKCSLIGGQCVKDGNADGIPDCSDPSCRQDTISPISEPPLGIIHINKNTSIDFNIIDENQGIFYYCTAMDNQTCCPDNGIIYYPTGNLHYPIQLSTSDFIDIYNSQGLYSLCYYAKDDYDNVEEVKCSPLWADYTIPKMDIQYEVIENTTGTYPIVSSLRINIILDEPATCTDYLSRGNTQFPSQITNEKRQNFSISYDNLNDGDYTHIVECFDDLGNIASNTTDIEIDAYQLVIINSPKGAVRNPVTFDVTTTDPADACIVYGDDPSIVQLSTTDNLNFISSQSYNLDRNRQYSDVFRVECHDSGSDAIDLEWFDFTVDYRGPKTTAIVKVNNQEKYRTDLTGWDSWQQATSTISLDCNPYPPGGYECETVYYCLTQPGDENICNPTTLYTSPISITESKQIYYNATDLGGNSRSQHGTLYIGEGVGIKLVNPKYGATNQPTIDLMIKLPVSTKECKFSFRDFEYDAIIGTGNYFDRLNSTHFQLSNFPDEQSAAGPFSQDNPSKTIYVYCNTTSGTINEDAAVFEIEYDPTPPVLEQAYFDPEIVVQYARTTMHAETDDKTRCIFKRLDPPIYEIKVPDNYDSDNPDFSEINEKLIEVSSDPADNGITYYYEVQCQNKAEDYSGTESISYTVDLNASGTITSLSPKGVTNKTSITLGVKTNKNAICEYQEGARWISLDSGPLDRREHTKDIGTKNQGNYSYLVRCIITDEDLNRSASISFEVDTTDPRMDRVEDWNYTCNPLQIQPEFSASDIISDIEKYEYQVLDSNRTPIINWTITSSNNPIIATDLDIGEKYYVKARAKDQAAFWSNELESDGFTVKQMSDPKCGDDKTPPEVTILDTKHCEDIEIEIQCSDESGCGNKLYGIIHIDSSDTCQANQTYTGPIKIIQSSIICYRVLDQIGNAKSGKTNFTIKDEDGDGVSDTCDICPDTDPGVLVTDDGCPPIDSDCDCSLGVDLDLDGYGINCEPIVDADDSICFDCDDSQRSIHENCQNGCIYDGDGDGYGFGCDAGTDCNDRDENVHAQEDCISGCLQDIDNDKFGIGCLNGLDCDDLNPSTYRGCTNGCAQDSDGDDYGLCCNKGHDCDDLNPSIKDECTSDCTSDKDCDQMPDDWETANGFDSNNPEDALLDPDKDDKTNLKEYCEGTDPFEPDLLIPERTGNILKTILFIVGILSILGGSGYIVYKKYLSKYLAKKPSTPLPARPAIKPTPVYRPPTPKVPAGPTPAELAEKERREKAIKLIKKRIKDKKEKKEKFFEAFGTPKIKTKLSKKEIKPILEHIKLPKKKHEFIKLKKFIEEYEPGKKELKSLLKKPEKAEQIFDELDSIIKKKVKIPKKKKPTPQQKKKVRDILYQVLKEKINQQELPEDLEKLREISKKRGKSQKNRTK